MGLFGIILLSTSLESAFINISSLTLAHSDQHVCQAEEPVEQRLLVADDFVVFGQKELDIGNLEIAESCFRQAVETAPKSADAHYYLGTTLEEQGLFDEASDAYRNAINGVEFGRIGVSDALVRLTAVLIENQEYNPTEIVDLLTTAIDTNDFRDRSFHPTEAHTRRGETLREQGQLDEAMLDYQWVVENFSDHWLGHMRLGELSWQHRQDSQQAIHHYEQAIAIEPENPRGYMALGRLFRQTEMPEQARETFNLVLEFAPDHQPAIDALQQLEEN